MLFKDFSSLKKEKNVRDAYYGREKEKNQGFQIHQ